MAPTTNQPSEKDAPGPDVSTLPKSSPSPERTIHSDEEGLPPQDRGRPAWTCLTAISAISMATWGTFCRPDAKLTADLTSLKGFGATQGVFREYYFNNPPFKGNQLVASIGLLVVVSNPQLDVSSFEDRQMLRMRREFSNHCHLFCSP